MSLDPNRFADDPLARAVREVLFASPDLLKPEYRGSANPAYGHCYVATQAYYYLTGGQASEWAPQVLNLGHVTHWFNRNGSGRVKDLTGEQFPNDVPYELGRGCGFSHRDQSQPDERTRECIARVAARHPELFRQT